MFPCSVTMVVKFWVGFTLEFSLCNCREVGFCYLTLDDIVPFPLPLHHTYSIKIIFHKFLDTLWLLSVMSAVIAACFSRVSASSFPRTGACALTQQNQTFQPCSSISVAFRPIFSMRDVCMLVFWRESYVVRLSVYMVPVLSSVCMPLVYSSD